MTTTFHLSQIKNIAAKLWQKYHEHKIWAFNAPMGAGKTTLIHALCEILEVKDLISSPTYAIINEYRSAVAGTIYHIDLYRLKNETEIINTGCEDCINSGNVCLIEWSEKAQHFLPHDTLQVSLEIISDFERRLKVNSLNT